MKSTITILDTTNEKIQDLKKKFKLNNESAIIGMGIEALAWISKANDSGQDIYALKVVDGVLHYEGVPIKDFINDKDVIKKILGKV
jgi:hypothetical protein